MRSLHKQRYILGAVLAALFLVTANLSKHDVHRAPRVRGARTSPRTAVAYLACDSHTAWVVCNAVSKLRSTGYDGEVLILSPQSLLFECASAEMLVVDLIEYPTFMKRRASADNHRYCRYTKFQLWNLDMYDSIIYLDWDTWVTGSIAGLWDYMPQIDKVAAVRDTVGPVFNSGVLLLRPDPKTFQNLVDLAKVHVSYNNGDQGLLNKYFYNKTEWLPYEYNVPAQLLQSAYWSKNPPDIIHFTGEAKPWSWHKRSKSKWKPPPADRSVALWYEFSNPKYVDCQSFRFYREPGFTCVISTFSRPYEMVQHVIDSVQDVDAIKSIRIKNLNPHKKLSTKFFVSRKPLFVDEYDNDSLNNRFDIKQIRTEGVFYLDDDIFLRRGDIEYILSVWQQHTLRLVGAFSRTHEGDSYAFDTKKKYSMVLTKAMAVSVDYVYRYTCSLVPQLKQYVTTHTNCEDILMNYIVASQTGQGPLFVAAVPAVDYGRKTGLSVVGGGSKAGFNASRSDCMAYFSQMFGGNPLQYSNVYLKAGQYTKTIVINKTFYSV